MSDIFKATGGSFPKNYTTLGTNTFFVADDGVAGRELWVTDGTGPSTRMVLDIHSSGESRPTGLTVFSGKIFFAAEDGTAGRELWTSDGTAGGTLRVADINPSGDSSPRGFAVIGSFLYFEADDGVNGKELWRSDGSAAGTVLLKDINPTGSSSVSDLVVLGSDIYFSAFDGTQRELWVSNGTTAGTMLLKDINAVGSSDPRLITVSGTRAFFVADDGVNGRELWATDGTVVGTALVKNVHPTADPEITFLTDVGGTLYFAATDGVAGYELWKSDGTTVGTVRVADISAGASDSTPTYLTNVGGTLFFSAKTAANGRELWKSNGTALGTVLVKDIYPGTPGSEAFGFALHNGQLFFSADDGQTGFELWKSDGSAAGTTQVADVYFGGDSSFPTEITSAGPLLFLAFTADDGLRGEEPWIYNGTTLSLLTDINTVLAGGDSKITDIAKFGNNFIFGATDGLTGRELWISDGTDAGTSLVKDIAAGPRSSSPGAFVTFGGSVYFTADDGTNGRELWITDGTPGGTAMLKDILPGAGSGQPTQLMTAGGRLFFRANNGVNGFELWTSDGTGTGTVLVRDIHPTASSMPLELTNLNGTLLFRADNGTNGDELWKSDGTFAGTVIVRDIATGSGSSAPSGLAAVGSWVYFAANSGTGGVELWRSDGTFGNTALFRNIRPGGANSSSFPSGITPFGTGFIFRADDGTTGFEPWISDGTAAGTVLLRDINPTGDSFASGFTEFQSQVYFSADDGTNGIELWRSNGTTAGTTLLVNINTAGDGSPQEITKAGGQLFFAATDSSLGREIWKSDGSAPGTQAAAEIRPTVFGSSPAQLIRNNGIIYCVADDGIHGRELWLVYEDAIAPVVSSVSPAGVSPTNAASLVFTVVFSEDVTGVDAADFAVVAPAFTGTSIASVVQNTADNYTVTVTTGIGEGTVRLDIIDDDSIKDMAKNPLGGLGAGNGNFTSGPSYTVDTVAPTVVSIVRAGPSPTNAASVDYTVTLSEDVSGLGIADFSVTMSGVTGASVVSRTNIGPGLYTVTVNTGAGDGTLRLDLIDNDSVVDSLNNPLGGPGAGNGSFSSGEDYTMDRTAPSVISIQRLDANPNSGATVDFLVTFSEAVTGVGVGDFALTTSGVVGAGIISRTNLTPTTTQVTVDTGVGDGSIRLDLADNDSIEDLATNPLGGAGAGNGDFTAGETYTIDKTVPTVQSVVRAGTNPTNATTVDFVVTFSIVVSGVDAGDFALTTSGSVSGASVTSVSAGPSMAYTVSVNTGTGDGTLRLDLLDDDSIRDAALKPLGGVGPGNGAYNLGEEFTLDKTAPTITSIVRLDASPSNAATVNFLVTFSEDVSGVTVPDFALTATGISTASIVSRTNLTPTTTSVLVNTGTTQGTLRLDVVDDDSIADNVGNKLGGTGAGNGSYTSGEIYSVDTAMPSVSAITRTGASPTNAAAVSFTVAMSEDVSGVDATDFSIAVSGLTGAVITGVVQNTPSNYTVNVNTGTGNGTIRLDLVDDDSVVDGFPNPVGGVGAGNGNFAGGETYTVDKSAPAVGSITRSSTNPTSAATVTYSVAFTENVSGVGTADFAPATTGVSGAFVVSSTPVSGSVYTVTVNTGTGDGTVRLDLVDDDSISDTAANLLGGTGAGNGNYTTGDVYTVIKTLPAVVSVARASGTPTNTASVQFDVQFNTPVAGVGINDFALATTGVSGSSITGISGGPTNYAVTVGTGSGDGTLRLDVLDDDSIVSGALLPLGGPGVGNGVFTSGEVFTIDKTPPTVSISGPSVSSTIAGPVDYTVSFTGASIVSMTNSNVVLNTSGTATGTVNVSGAGPFSRTVTITGISGDGLMSVSIVAGVATDAAGNSSVATGPSTPVGVGSVMALPVHPWLPALALLVAFVAVYQFRRRYRGR